MLCKEESFEMTDLAAAGSTTYSGNFRMKKPDNVQLAIPEAPELISREALKAFLEVPRANDSSVEIIDVRSYEEFASGAITGSVNIPYETFTPDAAKELAQKHYGTVGHSVVFASTQSPDLDLSAALVLMGACQEVGVKGLEVLILQMGLLGWFQAYGDNVALTQNFLSEKWQPILSQLKSPSKGSNA